MATAFAPTPILTSPDPLADVTLTAIFRPCDPEGLTTVEIGPAADVGDHGAYLELLDAAIARLCAYRADYASALADEEYDPWSDDERDQDHDPYADPPEPDCWADGW